MENELKDKIKETVSEYTTVVRELTALKNEVKQRNLRKKELSEKLVGLMRETNVDCFETTNNTIIHKQKKVHQCVGKKYLNSVLNDNFKDGDMVENIVDIIFNNRKIKIVNEMICKSN